MRLLHDNKQIFQCKSSFIRGKVIKSDMTVIKKEHVIDVNGQSPVTFIFETGIELNCMFDV